MGTGRRRTRSIGLTGIASAAVVTGALLCGPSVAAEAPFARTGTTLVCRFDGGLRSYPLSLQMGSRGRNYGVVGILGDSGEHVLMANDAVVGKVPGKDGRIKFEVADDDAGWGAILDRGGSADVIVDGKRVGRYDAAVSLKFEQGGKRRAFAAKRGGRYFAVVDGKEYDGFDEFPRVYFIGGDFYLQGSRSGRQVVLLNGKRDPGFEAPLGISCGGRDGKICAISAKRGREYIAIVDGDEYGGFTDYPGVRFQGDDFVIEGDRPGGHVVLLNGEPFAGSRADLADALRKRGARWKRRGGSWYCRVFGKEYGPYDEPLMAYGDGDDYPVEPVVSEKGRRAGFMARKGSRYYAVVDGREFGPFDLGELKEYTDYFDMAFSSDGSRYGFTVRTADGRSRLFVDGKEVVYSGMIPSGAPTFSPDAGRFAVPLEDGQGNRRIGAGSRGRMGPVYDDVSPVAFSPDGSRMTYLGVTDRRMEADVFRVVDATE